MSMTRRTRSGALSAAFALVISGLGAAVLATAPAAAAAEGPLTIVNQAIPSTSTGNNFSVLGFTTPRACDSQATRHTTKIIAVQATNPADQAEMDKWVTGFSLMYSPVGVGLPGPYTNYTSMNNLQGLANTYGQKLLPGTWTLEFRCQNNLGTTIYDRFRGTVVFDSPTSWHAVNVKVALPTTTTVSVPNTQPTVGEQVSVGATVQTTSAAPATTGTVQFFVDGVAVGAPVTVDATGNVTQTLTAPAAGDHTIKAVFAGSEDFATSEGSANLSVKSANSAEVATSTSLSAEPTTAMEGSSVAFTASVTAVNSTTPSGTVEFLDGTTVLGTGVLDAAGHATWSSATLTAGSHSVSARYAGVSGAYVSSKSAAVAITVTPAPKPTTTTITAVPATATVGDNVELTATVNPATATGIVRFFDGATFLGEGSLVSGSVKVTTPLLALGSHSVVAKYQGAAGAFLASDSAPVSVTINAAPDKAPSTIALSVTPAGPVAYQQKVTMSASVTSEVAPKTLRSMLAPLAVTAGTVEFFDGTTLLGSGTVGADGTVSFSTSELLPGTHQLTARFGGTDTIAASVSVPVSLIVNAATTGAPGAPTTPGADLGNGGTVVSAGSGSSGSSGGSLARTGAAYAGTAGLALLSIVLGGAGVLGARKRYAARHRGSV